MTISDFLHGATSRLQQAGIASARLDVLVLLEDALSRDRALILADDTAEITPAQEIELNKKLAQRAAAVPLAYIRGKAWFYGRQFSVNRHVLCPRPDSEAMIDLLKALPLPAQPQIADVGTGSGCLGLTAGLEAPDSRIILIDISKTALAIAERNAKQLGVIARLVQSDLLANLNGTMDVLLANLPYVPDNHPVNDDARYEPKLALFAGADGLDLYRRFWTQIAARPAREQPRYVVTESLRFQHRFLAALAGHAGYRLAATHGLAQQFEKA